MGVGQPARLLGDGAGHLGIAVAEAGHRRPARGIKVALAVPVDEIGALAARGHGQVGTGVAMEYVAHDAVLSWGVAR